MGAGVLVVSLKKGDSRQLILRSDRDPMIDAIFDLRHGRLAGRDLGCLPALIAGDGRVIGVIDMPPNMSGDLIDMALEEAPLRAAMLRLCAQHSRHLGVPVADRRRPRVPGAQPCAGRADAPARRQHAGLRRRSRRSDAHHRALGARDEIGVAERELARRCRPNSPHCCSRNRISPRSASR